MNIEGIFGLNFIFDLVISLMISEINIFQIGEVFYDFEGLFQGKSESGVWLWQGNPEGSQHS